jgi:hypothetical protein
MIESDEVIKVQNEIKDLEDKVSKGSDRLNQIFNEAILSLKKTIFEMKMKERSEKIGRK